MDVVNSSWRRPSKRAGITVAMVVVVCLGSCVRFEVFARADAPPSAEWFATSTLPLQNRPVVVSTLWEDEDEVSVLVANEGVTTLSYRSVGRSGIQSYQELESWGGWVAAGWDGCGTGKEDFELAPGEKILLTARFEDLRRERMLANFDELGTERGGLVVLACESRRLTFDPSNALLPVAASLAACGIWVTVRVVNRVARLRA